MSITPTHTPTATPLDTRLGQRVQIKPHVTVGPWYVGGTVGTVTDTATSWISTHAAVEITHTRRDLPSPVWVAPHNTTPIDH